MYRESFHEQTQNLGRVLHRTLIVGRGKRNQATDSEAFLTVALSHASPASDILPHRSAPVLSCAHAPMQLPT